MAEAIELAKGMHPGAHSGPQDWDANRFKTAIYGAVRKLIAQGRQGDIKRIVDRRDDARKTIDFDRNPFNWALLALKRSDYLDKTFDSNDINKIGWQLMHAHRHHVPPELLVGFLYQTAASTAGKQKMIKRSGAEYKERWFPSFEDFVLPSLPPRLRPGAGGA